MGLGNIVDEQKSNSSGSSSSGSSSSGGSSSSSGGSSSSSGYPKYRKRVPWAVVWEDDNGELQFRQNNQTLFHEQIKTTEDASWAYDKPTYDFHGKDSRIKRTWWTKQDLAMAMARVEQEIGANPMELLQEDVEKFCNALSTAANRKGRGEKPSLKRDCGVCGESLHTVTDDFEKVNNRIVCKHHTIQEISDADLL